MIELECKMCGSQLEVDVCSGHVYVFPCEYCINAAKQQVIDEAYET